MGVRDDDLEKTTAATVMWHMPRDQGIEAMVKMNVKKLKELGSKPWLEVSIPLMPVLGMSDRRGIESRSAFVGVGKKRRARPTGKCHRQENSHGWDTQVKCNPLKIGADFFNRWQEEIDLSTSRQITV